MKYKSTFFSRRKKKSYIFEESADAIGGASCQSRKVILEWKLVIPNQMVKELETNYEKSGIVYLFNCEGS